ncbi:MAG: extracellular solute-binding protein, partial [Pseudomonadota bacterium]
MGSGKMRLGMGLVSALALSVASLSAEAQTDVTFWHSFGSGKGAEAIDLLVERFNGSQEDVIVTAEFVGDYDEMVTKLQAAIPAGNQPDIVQLEATRYGLFADRGTLEPLEPYFEATGQAFVDDIRPFALEASLYQGNSYVIPFNVSTPLLYYNKDA